MLSPFTKILFTYLFHSQHLIHLFPPSSKATLLLTYHSLCSLSNFPYQHPTINLTCNLLTHIFSFPQQFNPLNQSQSSYPALPSSFLKIHCLSLPCSNFLNHHPKILLLPSLLSQTISSTLSSIPSKAFSYTLKNF